MVFKAMQDYKEHVGQKFQAKSYLWSAVVNIKPDTTMQDLERLATHFKTKYGFQCYQIAIHRDEGHIDDDGKEQINQHAHLEFVTLDSVTGKNRYQRRKITPNVLSQMQTEVADILGMQRGEDAKKSGRKRIEPRAYGKLMNEVRQKHNAEKQELKTEKDNILKNLNKAVNVCCGFLDSGLIIEQDKEGLEPLTPDNTESNLIEMANRAKKRYADREATQARINTIISRQRDNIMQQKQELETSNAALNTQLNELKGQHAKELKAKDTELATLKTTTQQLQQEKQELEANNEELLATLTTTLTDLTGFVAPHDKKLTIKEMKPLIENVRLQWKDINQRLGEYEIFTQGEYKIFTQEDYKALLALKKEGLTIGDLKKRIVALEQEAKERNEAYKALQEQYKDYLSPEAVQELKQKHIEALEAKNTEHTKAVANLKQEHSKELDKVKQEITTLKTANANLETAHAKAVEELKTASALKDKQITELTAQKQEAEQKASSLEKEIEALRGSQYVVNVYANSRLKNSNNYEWFFANAVNHGYPIVGFLVGKHICYFALKEPEWKYSLYEWIGGTNSKKPDYEALLLETIKRYYPKLLEFASGNNVVRGVGWKSGLEIVERDDEKDEHGLVVDGETDLTDTIMQCYDHDKFIYWKEAKDKTDFRYPPTSYEAFQATIAPVWFKPRLEGLNIRLYDFLGKDLPQIDVVAFKDDWGLMRETMDYIASLNRQKLRDTHKEKRQQHAKGWYARSKVEKRVKQRAQEQAKQLKTNTPTPSKSKDTPKPTEPQKSPQPIQDTTPKKPLGM
ncbi:hypothetical protein [Helicobacter felistomachi]|uniref:hypothetical protein n=1 Tax=Helicobacter felistomachi TaxID=3040201 RepID=UPI00257354AD|nr:hypothetical protein [Helicobacter sp. NHP21005]